MAKDVNVPAIIQFSEATELRAVSQDDETIDIFHGECKTPNAMHTAFRRCTGHDWSQSRIFVDDTDIAFGEDPRIFTHNGKLCVLAVVALSGYPLRNHLVEFDGAQTRRYFLALPNGLSPGKNWSAFTFSDGALGFIHSFDPLIVLKERRREDGLMVLDVHEGKTNVTEAGPEGYSCFRGGTAGLPLVDGLVFGFGHTTRYLDGAFISWRRTLGFDHLFHRPFLWVLDPEDRAVTVHDLNTAFPTRPDIMDPTSLVATGDSQYRLTTTEVDRHFADREGTARHVTYDVTIDTAALRTAHREDRHTTVIRPDAFFHHDGTLSDGYLELDLKGRDDHILYGPYLPLGRGTYEVCLRLASSSVMGQREARLDIDVTADADANLAKARLPLSDLNTAKPVSMPFYIASDAERSVEFRIHARGFSDGQLRLLGAGLRRLPD